MIQISPAAQQEILRLHAKLPPSDPAALAVQVHLSLQPSACLTHTYAIAFTPTPQPTDHIFACNGIHLVVPTDHLPLLDGLTLDYSEDLMGGNFRFHNPNAQQVCGCGHSFAI